MPLFHTNALTAVLFDISNMSIYLIDVTTEDANSKLVGVVAKVSVGVGKCLQLLGDMFRHLHCHKNLTPRLVLALVTIVLKYW